jgi:hypothetical protein
MMFALCPPMSPLLRRPAPVATHRSPSRPGLRGASSDRRPRWSRELVETPYGWRRARRRPVMLWIKTAASIGVFAGAVWWLLL